MNGLYVIIGDNVYNIEKFKLGVGPMSKEIIDCIDNFSKDYPLMIVASRNQVDYDSGYVCNTFDLAGLIESKNLLLCRDHCGPYFSDKDKNLTLSEALEECKKTIKSDINEEFDLIHIDVSRIGHHQLDYARELIEYALDLDSDIMLEFGSEDNTGEGLEPSLSRLNDQLEFISSYIPNIKFFVTQTGSFTQHKQMGNFDIEVNTRVAEKIHSYGLLFKEHNADYLTIDEINKRNIARVDAMNIAPQLGVIQTRILKELSNDNKEWYEFSKRVYDSNIWKKWLPKDVHNKELAVLVGGHYHFNSIEYRRLLNTVDVELFREKLEKELFDVFYSYIGNI